MAVSPLDSECRRAPPSGGWSAGGYLGALHSAAIRPLRAWRRRILLARLRGAPPPRTVLFLCQGNLYRSPYAAAVFRAALPAPLRSSVRVASAGFMGSGRTVPPIVARIAASRGLELRSHRSTLVSTEAIAAADLVVVMEPAVQRAVCERFGRSRSDVLILGELDPRGSDSRSIPDPAGRALVGLAKCFGRIERCVIALARALPRPPTPPTHSA